MSKSKVDLERFDTGETEEMTLEEAVLASTSGDIIHLNVGVYKVKETLLIDHTSLTMKGKGTGKSIITSSKGGCVVRFIGAFSWTIQDISFQYTGKKWANVVEVDGNIIDHQNNAQIRIQNCHFSGAKRSRTQLTSGAGLLIWGSTEGLVENCEAFDNASAGIRVDNCARPNLTSNICRDNGIAGIVYNDLAAGLATKNKLRTNNWGIAVLSEANPQLSANTFWRNEKKLVDWRNGDFDEDTDE